MPLMPIGDYTVDRVVELECTPFGAREFFPDLSAEMLEHCRAVLPRGQITADNLLSMSFQATCCARAGTRS